MPNIYSHTSDLWIIHLGTTNWTSSRDATSGTHSGRTSIRYGNAPAVQKGAARGGGNIWVAGRAFFMFDTSGISEAPASAKLNLYPYLSGASADFFVVESTIDIEPASFLTEYDSITGWNNSGVDNESNVTKYSSEFDASADWNTSAYNGIDLNATALSRIASLDMFKVCVIESVHDLRNVEPSTTPTPYRIGLYYQNNTGTSKDPYLEYTVATAGDNATFFGCNF